MEKHSIAIFASGNGTKIQSSDTTELEKIFNAMFYCKEKNMNIKQAINYVLRQNKA